MPRHGLQVNTDSPRGILVPDQARLSPAAARLTRLAPANGGAPLAAGDSVRLVSTADKGGDLGDVVAVDITEAKVQVRWPPRKLPGGRYARKGPLTWHNPKDLLLVVLPLPAAAECSSSSSEEADPMDGGPVGYDPPLELGDKVILARGAEGGNCIKRGEIGTVIQIDAAAIGKLQGEQEGAGPPYKVAGPRESERGGREWFSCNELRRLRLAEAPPRLKRVGSRRSSQQPRGSVLPPSPSAARRPSIRLPASASASDGRQRPPASAEVSEMQTGAPSSAPARPAEQAILTASFCDVTTLSPDAAPQGQPTRAVSFRRADVSPLMQPTQPGRQASFRDQSPRASRAASVHAAAAPEAAEHLTHEQRVQLRRRRPTVQTIAQTEDPAERLALEQLADRLGVILDALAAATLAALAVVSQLPLPADSTVLPGHSALCNVSGVPKADIDARRYEIEGRQLDLRAGFAHFHDIRGYVRNPEEIICDREQTLSRAKWISRSLLGVVALGVVVFIICFLALRSSQSAGVLPPLGSFNSPVLYLRFNTTLAQWSDRSFRDAVSREAQVSPEAVVVRDKWEGSVHVLFYLANLTSEEAVRAARRRLQEAALRDVARPTGEVPTALSSAFVANGLLLDSLLFSGDGLGRPVTPVPDTAAPTGSPVHSPTGSPTLAPTPMGGERDLECGRRIEPGLRLCRPGLEVDWTVFRCRCPAGSGLVCVHSDCISPVWSCVRSAGGAGICPEGQEPEALGDCQRRCVSASFCVGVLHDLRRPKALSCQLAYRDGLGLGDLLRNTSAPQTWCTLHARELPKHINVSSFPRVLMGETAQSTVALQAPPVGGPLHVRPTAQGVDFTPESVVFTPEGSSAAAFTASTRASTEYHPDGLMRAEDGWPDARDQCHGLGAGWRLCTHAEYCPKGNGSDPVLPRPPRQFIWGALRDGGLMQHGLPPADGAREIDLPFPTPRNWSGEWVALGSRQPPCALYSELTGAHAEWTDMSFNGTVLCCRIADSAAYFRAANGTAARPPAGGFAVPVEWNLTGAAVDEYRAAPVTVLTLTAPGRGWVRRPEPPLGARQGALFALPVRLQRPPGGSPETRGELLLRPRALYHPPEPEGNLAREAAPSSVCVRNRTAYLECLRRWAAPASAGGTACLPWRSNGWWSWLEDNPDCEPFLKACHALHAVMDGLCVAEPLIFEPPVLRFPPSEHNRSLQTATLGAVAVRGGSFSVFFELPDLAKAAPAGPACLGGPGGCEPCWRQAAVGAVPGSAAAAEVPGRCAPGGRCAEGGGCGGCRDCLNAAPGDVRAPGARWEDAAAEVARCRLCWPRDAAAAEEAGGCSAGALANCSAPAARALAARRIDLPAPVVFEVASISPDLEPSNVAPTGVASQSSRPSACSELECGAANAIDLDLSGSNGRISVSSFDWPLDAAPWWRLQLPRVVGVHAVVVHNRGDCCADRLYNITVALYRSGVRVWRSATMNKAQSLGSPEKLMAVVHFDLIAGMPLVVADEVVVSKYNDPSNPLSRGILATLNIAEVEVQAFENPSDPQVVPFSNDTETWIATSGSPQVAAAPIGDPPAAASSIFAPVYPPIYEETADQVLWNVAPMAAANQSSTAQRCPRCAASTAVNGVICPLPSSSGASEHTMTDPGLYNRITDSYSLADREPWLLFSLPQPVWVHSVVVHNRMDCPECMHWLRDVTVTLFWGPLIEWESTLLNPGNELSGPFALTALPPSPHRADGVRISKVATADSQGLDVTLSVSEVEIFAYEPLDLSAPPGPAGNTTVTRTVVPRPQTPTVPVVATITPAPTATATLPP
eukprot:TRINITY_DN11358_c0_g6_i1.p1 TRINITY_DN11358_c0_g6~~TRINITY_DN11358_c0_g6_i1.p1  ORF type:complete len:1830 (+),score=363.73 TRINITY_DN11358_c0_g6_i1:77-5491(+)